MLTENDPWKGQGLQETAAHGPRENWEWTVRRIISSPL